MKKQLLKLGKILPAVLLWSGISAQYCIPTYTTGCTSGDDIDDFQIVGGNLNHIGSGCSANAYGDFTGDPALTAELSAGLTYNFAATHNFGSQYIKIWIDFNGDEVFDDTDELLFTSTNGATNTSGSITIPFGATPTTTRMRVMSRWNSAPTDACTPGGGWGETHDYTVEIQPAPSCLPISNLTTLVIGINDIEVAWEDQGTGDNWNVEWGTPGFTPDTGAEIGTSTVNDTSEMITGLDPNTSYEIYVQADCGGGDLSTWMGPLSVTTNCALTSATFTEDFDAVSTPAVPNCWTAIAVGSNQFVRCQTITTATPNSTPNHVEMYNSATSGAAEHVMLVGPGVDDLSSGLNQLRFFAKRGTNAVDLEVGTMSDPSDPTTFTLLTTITDLTTTYEEFTVFFSNYTGSDEYFVFKHGNTSATQYVYIDDVVWEPMPACPQPSDLVTSNIETNEIDITWTDNAGSSSWNLEWGTPGFTPGTGTEIGASTASATSENITGLDPNTTYDVYVQSDCGLDGESIWAGPLTVTTNCTATTATYTQNFDGVSTPDIPSCWNPIAIGSNANVRCRTITGFTPNSLPNQAELYNSATAGAAEHVILVSPQFSDLPSAENQIRFFSRRGTNVVDLEIGTMSDPNDPTTFTLYETVTGLTTTHQEFIVAFDNYAGTDEYVAFRHPNTASNQYLFVDDFNWEPIPSCPLPTDLDVTNITLTEADLSWTDNAGASQWEVEWDEAGFALGNGNNSTETATNLSLTGLDDGTTYEFYVRADCGGGDFSDWVGPFEFTTVAVGSTCGAPIIVNTLPYFDSGNTADYGDNYASADRPPLGTEQFGSGTGTGLYLNGDDVVYSFTPTQTGLYNVGLENTGAWAGLWLFEGCDPFTEVVGFHTVSAAGSRLLPNILLTENVTYYVVISTYPSPQSTMYDLTICQSEDASFEYASQLLCELETSFMPTITGEQGGTFSSITGLTLDPSTGEINPSTSNAGTYEVVYTTDGGICSGSDTVIVEIAGIEDASFEYDANLYCILDDNAFPTITGQAGGEFSAGAGLAINNSTGEINPATSSPGNYTVEYTSSTTACATTESWDVEIVMNENASFNYSSNEFCQNYMDITPTISGVQGGTFSAEAGLAINAQTGQIGAEASSIGTFWVYYTTPGQDCPATDSVQISIQECLSLDENTISQIEVYPNPARDIVNVSLPTVQGSISIDVMDATGKLVMNKTVNGNVGKEQLNIINLEKGVYLIRFTGNEMNTTKRIVVTK